MFEQLKNSKRLLIEAELLPVQGQRFQPTGFPDLGAATYQLSDGTRMLLVESAQSIANRLENTIIASNNDVIEDLKGLSYIKVKLEGESNTTTSSLVEAHRINSPFIISNESFRESFIKDSGYESNKPVDWQKIAQALFKYDINSLLHGVFLANLGDGRIKMPRAVSGFIEAKNVQEVVSGGVKNNPIDPTGLLRAKNHDKDVYGNVPYQRVEFTAESITAFFNIDLSLLRSYTIDKSDAYELLVALALFKIRTFLEDGTRLRTACDLKINGNLKTTQPEGITIPSIKDLISKLKDKIANCHDMFASPPVTELNTETVLKKPSK